VTGSELPFVKGHGTENDFVVLPDPDGELDLTPELVRALCDRRAGIGGDGVLRVVRTAAAGEPGLDPAAEWFLDYRNADGSVAEMCGNGVRVYARYLVDAGLAEPGRLRIATRGGTRSVEVGASGDVTVDMGTPTFPAGGEVPVTVGGRARPGVAVLAPNPHVVVLGDEPVDGLDLTRPPGVPDGAFPDGVNVEVVQRAGPGHLVMRVHERGVGETRSCGTGVAAVAAVAAAEPGAGSRWTVDVPGGRLTVTVGQTVVMTGPALLVGSGTLGADWLAEVLPADPG
jgi:diaminopimelate epimerase